MLTYNIKLEFFHEIVSVEKTFGNRSVWMLLKITYESYIKVTQSVTPYVHLVCPLTSEITNQLIWGRMQGVAFCDYGSSVPPPALFTWAVPIARTCFSSSDKFLFCWLPCFPSASWLLSFLSLFLWPYLIHARMSERSRAFVHGHTFLHSWNVPMNFVISLLHGAMFLSNPTLVPFVSLV